MKNSILKFKQMFEGLELDDELVRNLTEDLEDLLDIEFTLKKGYFNERDNFSSYMFTDRPTSKEDRLAYMINIDFNKIKLNKKIKNNIFLYEDDKLFDIFSQIRKISRVCKTYTILLSTGIKFIMISDEEIETDEDTELYKLYTKISDRFSRLRSDFGYATMISFEDNKIIIKTDGSDYTDRKLKMALNGLPLTDFKITKVIEGGEVFNTIEKK